MRHVTRQAARVVALISVLFLAGPTAAAQGFETATRVMAVDAKTGALTILDTDNGEVVGRFTTPNGGFTPVYPSPGGRYLFVNHYEGEAVTVVDSGLRTADHGDHVDLVEGAPFVRATVDIGRSPAHYWAHDGLIAVYSDAEGTITLFDEARLADGAEPLTFAVGPPDHASIAVVDGTLLVGFYGLGRVDAYDLGGRLVQEAVGSCPAAHGEGLVGDTVAFACDDGVLLVARSGAELRSRKIAYPGNAGAAGSPVATPEATPATTDAPARSNLIAWHGDSPVMVGDFPGALALIEPERGSVELLPLPARPLWMSFGQDGERLAVLTDDGVVHAVDPVAGQILWSTPATDAYADLGQDEGGQRYPMLAAAKDAVYVPNPTAGEIVELSLDSGRITDRFAVGGDPVRVALVQASGVTH